MVVFIVYHTELSRGNAMYLLIRMDDVCAVGSLLYCCMMIFWSVANLKCDARFVDFCCEEMEIMNLEVLLVSSLWVIAVADIQYICLYILLYNKPRATTKAKTFALTDSVKP